MVFSFFFNPVGTGVLLDPLAVLYLQIVIRKLFANMSIPGLFDVKLNYS